MSSNCTIQLAIRGALFHKHKIIKITDTNKFLQSENMNSI